MSFEFFDAAATSPSGASNGVFIPISDLPGVSAGELDSATGDDIKTAKVVLGMMNAIASNLPQDALGLTMSRNTNSGGLDLTNNAFTINHQFYADHEAKTIDSIPVPNTGENSGVGTVAVTDVFANAVKVDADGAISGEGVLIASNSLVRYGSPVHGSLDPSADSRIWFQALGAWLTQNLTVRSPSVASAVTGLTRGGTQTVSLPPSATNATNPTSGIAAADLNKSSFFSHNYSVTIQTAHNQAAQTFEVNVVTS